MVLLTRSRLFGVSAGSFIVSILLYLAHIYIPDKLDIFLQGQIKKAVVWQPNAPPETYARYESDSHPGDPVDHLRFWLFNITNLKEVKQGYKPILEEVGPFTFIVGRKKVNIEFSPDNSTVQFQEYLYFLEDLNPHGPSLDVPVTTLNLPLVGALAHLKALPSGFAGKWLEVLASWVEGWRDARVDGLFTTRTAGELIWGYQDPLLSKLAHFVPGLDPTFALAKNMTSEDEASPINIVSTGADDINNIWQYQTWHNIQEVTSWNPPHIEKVHGSDALQFRPGIKPGQELWVWVGELFRSARLMPMVLPGENPHTSLGGLPLIRYRPDVSLQDPDPRYFQEVRGLMNVTSPMAGGPTGKAGQPGVPLFLSLPHFCFVDEEVAAGVEGLQCDLKKHDLFLDVEPTTGVTLRAKKSLMMSSRFNGAFSKKIDPHLRDTILPIFWAQEGSQAAGAQLRALQPLRLANSLNKFLREKGVVAARIHAIVGGLAMFVALVFIPKRYGPWEESDADEGEEGADVETALLPEGESEEEERIVDGGDVEVEHQKPEEHVA